MTDSKMKPDDLNDTPTRDEVERLAKWLDFPGRGLVSYEAAAALRALSAALERAEQERDALERVRRKERERCAKVAEGFSREVEHYDSELEMTNRGRTIVDPRKIAAAIRGYDT